MRQLSIRRGTLALIRAQLGIFLLAMLGGVFYFGTRLVPGWIEKLTFDRLTLGPAADPSLSLGALVGLLLAVEVVRSLVDYGGKMSETLIRNRGGSLMRANVVHNLLRRRQVTFDRPRARYSRPAPNVPQNDELPFLCLGSIPEWSHLRCRR